MGFSGGGGGAASAIGLYTGAGYPTISANKGDIYRANDGWPGGSLFEYVGAFAGLPTVVNFGAGSPTATGAFSCTMQRAVTVGNLLVAFSCSNSNYTQLTPVAGWTILDQNNTPSAATQAVYKVAAAGDSPNPSPFTCASLGGGNAVIVVEIANFNSGAPIVQHSVATNMDCTSGNLALVFMASNGGVNTSKPRKGYFDFNISTTSQAAGIAQATGYGIPIVSPCFNGINVNAPATAGGAVGIELVEIAKATSGTTQLWVPIA